MKLIPIFLTALLLSGAGLVATVASYPVQVNGETLNTTVLNQNGTTYLPLKAVGQALGAEVKWTGEAVEISTVDVEELKKACVMIKAENDAKGTQGSAVCWDYGEYLTANHVIDGKTDIKSPIAFKIDKTDSKLDIATLDTDDKTKPVKIGDSDEVKAGDVVILISSPDGKENTISYGKVAFNSTWIDVMGESREGSSGGALFNANGELIGILTAGNMQNTRYSATPINDIREAF